MNLSDVKKQLPQLNAVRFKLPSGELVPVHFHITEVGQITKHFIDCGGTIRHEKKVSFQLWQADDTDHRLSPEKLLRIINLSEEKLGIEDAEIEVEYQAGTIGKFGLGFDGENFLLENTQTACLASDHCGIPVQKTKQNLADLGKKDPCCTPGSSCCN